MPPRSASSMIGRSVHCGKVMSLTGRLSPARVTSCGLKKKSGMTNSRRTLDVSNPPPWPIRTDQTELRFSSSGRLFQAAASPRSGELATE
jgi:hypothetical protein